MSNPLHSPQNDSQGPVSPLTSSLNSGNSAAGASAVALTFPSNTLPELGSDPAVHAASRPAMGVLGEAREPHQLSSQPQQQQQQPDTHHARMLSGAPLRVNTAVEALQTLTNVVAQATSIDVPETPSPTNTASSASSRRRTLTSPPPPLQMPPVVASALGSTIGSVNHSHEAEMMESVSGGGRPHPPMVGTPNSVLALLNGNRKSMPGGIAANVGADARGAHASSLDKGEINTAQSGSRGTRSMSASETPRIGSRAPSDSLPPVDLAENIAEESKLDDSLRPATGTQESTTKAGDAAAVTESENPATVNDSSLELLDVNPIADSAETRSIGDNPEEMRKHIPLVHETVAKMTPFVSTSTSATGVDEDWIIPPEFSRPQLSRRDNPSNLRNRSGHSQLPTVTPSTSTTNHFSLPGSPQRQLPTGFNSPTSAHIEPRARGVSGTRIDTTSSSYRSYPVLKTSTSHLNMAFAGPVDNLSQHATCSCCGMPILSTAQPEVYDFAASAQDRPAFVLPTIDSSSLCLHNTQDASTLVHATVEQLVAHGGIAGLGTYGRRYLLPDQHSALRHGRVYHTVHPSRLMPASSPTVSMDPQLSAAKIDVIHARAAALQTSRTGVPVSSASVSIRSEPDEFVQVKQSLSAHALPDTTGGEYRYTEPILSTIGAVSGLALTQTPETVIPPNRGPALHEIFEPPTLHAETPTVTGSIRSDGEGTQLYAASLALPSIQVAYSIGSASSGLSTALAEVENVAIDYPDLRLEVAKQMTTPSAIPSLAAPTDVDSDFRLDPASPQGSAQRVVENRVADPISTTVAMSTEDRSLLASNYHTERESASHLPLAEWNPDAGVDSTDVDEDDEELHIEVEEDEIDGLLSKTEDRLFTSNFNNDAAPKKVTQDDKVDSTPRIVAPQSGQPKGTRAPSPSKALCALCHQRLQRPMQMGPAQDSTYHLVIAMVGLPARGKSYISKKLSRYLRWLRYDCRVFDVSDYRRQVYGSGLPMKKDDVRDKVKPRELVTKLALGDMAQFLINGGKIAVYDSSNINVRCRHLFKEYLRGLGINFSLLWVESICTDDALIEANILDRKLFSPDYGEDVDVESAIRDFKERLEDYTKFYEPVTESELTLEGEGFVKLINTGHRVQAVNIRGYLLTKIVFYLMNLQITKSPIYFSRHGESQANICGQVGTDSALSKAGRKYAEVLAEWLRNQPELLARNKGLNIYCSTLQRTIATAGTVFKALSPILPIKVIKWRALAEISAGIYDGMTYAEIERADPAGYAERNRDKLNYKYPQGESYKDVIDRVERVIFELERSEAPVIVIAHQAVIRCLLGYFLDKDINDIPHLSVPLHTVIKVQPHAFGVNQEVYEIYPTSTSHKHA